VKKSTKSHNIGWMEYINGIKTSNGLPRK